MPNTKAAILGDGGLHTDSRAAIQTLLIVLISPQNDIVQVDHARLSALPSLKHED